MKTLSTLAAIAISAYTFSQTLPNPATMAPGLSNSTSITVNQNELTSGSGLINAGGSLTISLTPLPSNNGNHRCATYDLNQQHYADRGILNEFNQDALQGAQNASAPGALRTPGVNNISVIFHVVHNTNNPAENVSNALIMQVFQDLTDDFQLLNANAVNARTGAPYNFTPADANINFCLATQDEGGAPLTEVGVIRVVTTEVWYDSDNGEENKMKASATGGSQIWDRNDYLNIWICDISNGAGSGTAGYAYRPSLTFLPGSGIDGIVLDYNLGMNNENILTHEVGHYLGLDHTWGGSGGCGNDDGFGDTPNTAGPSFDYPGSCSGSQQTCGATETQYENYMDYANCTVMYTQNQADYMLQILTGIRSSLLLSAGCDPTNTPPISAWSSIPLGPSPVIIPVNGGVNFIDESSNVPTGWAWTISGIPGTDWNYIGGTSASSQDPQVEFYNVGLYDVALTASNIYGTDPSPASELSYVQVVAPAAGLSCDTIRNYNLFNPFYTLTTADGYIHGNTTISGETVLEWAEPYTVPATTEIRGIEFALTRVNDNGGDVIFKVFGPGATPGALLASDTITLASLTEAAWNKVIFTSPPSLTGAFWVGYELSYSGTDTIAMYSDYNPAPATNYAWVNRSVSGWEEAGPLFVGSPAFAHTLDVLTSNGAAPVMGFSATDNELCVGGDIIVNGSSSINNGDYRWYVTDDPWVTSLETSGLPNNTFNFPYAPGNYNIYLFGDGSCLSSGVFLPITLNANVAATVTPTGTNCGINDGVITITGATGGDGSYLYSLDGINYQASNTFTGLAAGDFDVYVATIGDNCEVVYTVTVPGSTPFTAGVSANSSVCPGGSATITASGGVSYQWYDGATLIASIASTTVSPGATTQYMCVVNDGSGCQSIVYTTVTIYVPVAPVITASGPTTICSGTTVDLTSSYATNNLWSTAEISSTITVSAAGDYWVTGIDANGCSSTSLTTTIVVNTSPTIAAGTVTDPSSCGSSTGSIVVTGSGTGNVSWTGTASGSAIVVSLPYTITGLAAGSYNITYVDGNGCSSNLLAQGINDPTPPATPTVTASGAIVFCAGGSVDLTSSQASGNTWSNAEITQTITVTTSGAYSVTYTNGSGCSATSLPTVVVVNALPSTPTITAGGATTFCDGGSVQLTSSQGTGNTWSTAESTQVINVTASGTYTVTYTDGNGCSTTSAGTVVTMNALPTVTQTSLGTICDYDGVITLSSGSPAGGTYSGTGVSGTTFDPAVSGLGTFVITYSYTDGNGCTNTADENLIVDACLSVSEIISQNVSVYPNPTTDELNIEVEGEFDYTICDARGRIVFIGSGTDKIVISTVKYEVGVYMINIKTTDINAMIRVVKQ